MKYGFLKVCAVTPEIQVADCGFNKKSIWKCIENANKEKVKLAVFPELCITGASCGDLFLHKPLLDGAKETVLSLAEDSRDMDMVCVLGAPLLIEGAVYNCAVIFHRGRILAIIPGLSGGEFAPGEREPKIISFGGQEVAFGSDILVRDKGLEGFVLAAEVGRDGLLPVPPSSDAAAAGATVIASLMASKANISDMNRAYEFEKSQSERLHSAFVCADAGYGESTTDYVFSGKNMIFEDGILLKEGGNFVNDAVITEIDVDKIAFSRRKNGFLGSFGYYEEEIELEFEKTPLSREFSKMPFVIKDNNYFEEAVSIQAASLRKRLEHTGMTKAVIGVSGGLDSTMTLLVAVRAFDKLGIPRKNITAITMPCFGTTKRTRSNAQIISEELGVSFREISIKGAVSRHFKDIDQPEDRFDAAFENAQARERTQVLMDIANQIGGLAIGTGDMSELALGWATYNGDHMSMYGVNCGVPKTLMRFLVGYEADRIGNEKLKAAVTDILDTPVSPELLPPEKGEIAQKTEQTVGPYILHDFFLYNMLYNGFSPEKLQYVVKNAFKDDFSAKEAEGWLEVFLKRFFSQQFKRSCSPDGVDVCGISLSPRGGLVMPSDAKSTEWLKGIGSRK